MAKFRLLLVAALAACAASDDTPDLLAQAMAREEKANKQLDDAQKAENMADSADSNADDINKATQEAASKKNDEQMGQANAAAAAARNAQARERQREVEKAEERAEEAARKKKAAFCKENPKAASCQSTGYQKYLNKYGMGHVGGNGAQGKDYSKYMKADQYTKQGNEGGGSYQQYMTKYAGDYGKYLKQRGKPVYGNADQNSDFGGDYKAYMKKDYAQKNGKEYQESETSKNAGSQYIQKYAGSYQKYMKKENTADTVKYWKDHDNHLKKIEGDNHLKNMELASDNPATGATNFPLALVMGIAAVPAGGVAAHLAMSYKNAVGKPAQAPEGYIACDA